MKINLGQIIGTGKPLDIDLNTLMETRLLIQANISELRTAGVLVGKNTGIMKASDELLEANQMT